MPLLPIAQNHNITLFEKAFLLSIPIRRGSINEALERGSPTLGDLKKLLSYFLFYIKYRRKIGTSNEREGVMGKIPYLALVASKGWT